jgi:hypothetical protein
MTEYKEQDFFEGFDFPEEEVDNTPDYNIPAMEFLDQMLFRINIYRLSQFNTEEQKATAAELNEHLEYIKEQLLDSITLDKREDYEKRYSDIRRLINDFRFYINAFARPILKDRDFVQNLFRLCKKMEIKLRYMTPLHEGARKRLPKTHRAHFAKMPECAKKYYAKEIKALEVKYD